METNNFFFFLTLFVPRAKEGPLSVPEYSKYSKYSIRYSIQLYYCLYNTVKSDSVQEKGLDQLIKKSSGSATLSLKA